MDAPSLKSTYVMYLRHKSKGSLFIKYRTSIFGGKKAPAGAHPDTTNLDNTDSVFAIHVPLFAIHTKAQNQDFRCPITDLYILGRSKNDGFRSEMGRRGSPRAHILGKRSTESKIIIK